MSIVDENRLTVQAVYDDLKSVDKDLRELRRRADHRELQYTVMTFGLPSLANLKPPTGLGVDIDAGLIKAIAAATLLLKSLRRAQKNVYGAPEDLDDLIRCIDRLLPILPRARAHLELHGADPNKPPEEWP